MRRRRCPGLASRFRLNVGEATHSAADARSQRRSGNGPRSATGPSTPTIVRIEMPSYYSVILRSDPEGLLFDVCPYSGVSIVMLGPLLVGMSEHVTIVAIGVYRRLDTGCTDCQTTHQRHGTYTASAPPHCMQRSARTLSGARCSTGSTPTTRNKPTNWSNW